MVFHIDKPERLTEELRSSGDSSWSLRHGGKGSELEGKHTLRATAGLFLL